MDKRGLLTFLFVIILFVAGYYAVTHISFVEVEEFGGFPVPKGAEVSKEKENFIAYDWARATFEHGIPRQYKKELKKERWEEVSTEGGTIYTKNDLKVLLTFDTDYISISIVE